MRGASAPGHGGHSQIGKLPQGGDLLEHKSRTNKHGMQSGPFLQQLPFLYVFFACVAFAAGGDGRPSTVPKRCILSPQLISKDMRG